MMHDGSQGLVARAIASIRHGMGSRLAFEAARCKEHGFSLLRHAGDLPLRGFAVTVRSAPCLAIEDGVGCRARILAGQAWFTAEGTPRDTIAGAGTTVPLERGIRFNVSAFRHSATVLVTAPCNLTAVDFAMHERDGMPVLSVTSSTSSLSTSISEGPAAIAAFAKRYFMVTGAASP